MGKETMIEGFILGRHVEIKCSTREQADFLRIKLAGWLDEVGAPAYTEDESFWKNRSKAGPTGLAGDLGAGLTLWIEASEQDT